MCSTAHAAATHCAEVADPSRDSSFSPDGWTPLHEAAARGLMDTTRLLVEHGANLEIQNKGENAAVRQWPHCSPRTLGSAETLTADAYGCMSTRALHNFADGDTPLHVAASHHMAAAVTYLLEKGANANAMNNVRRMLASHVCTRLTLSAKLSMPNTRALICCARRPGRTKAAFNGVRRHQGYATGSEGPRKDRPLRQPVLLVFDEGGCMVPGLQLSAGQLDSDIDGLSKYGTVTHCH